MYFFHIDNITLLNKICLSCIHHKRKGRKRRKSLKKESDRLLGLQLELGLALVIFLKSVLSSFIYRIYLNANSIYTGESYGEKFYFIIHFFEL